MRALKLQFAWIFVLAIVTAVAAQTPAPAPSLDQIVSQMEAARTEQRPAPFLLTREYRMFHGEEAKPTSEVKAQINVVPQQARDYKIVETHGSTRGEGVVRKILDYEAKSEKKNPPPSAVTRDNYDFEYLGEEQFQNARCYVLKLKPKRKDPSLVDGKAWVDAETFYLWKIQGEMAKSPSWWVKEVNLTVLYGEMGGIWMQTLTQANAKVRILGQYKISGQATDVKTSSAVASNRMPRKSQRRVPAPAGVLPGVLAAR